LENRIASALTKLFDRHRIDGKGRLMFFDIGYYQ